MIEHDGQPTIASPRSDPLLEKALERGGHLGDDVAAALLERGIVPFQSAPSERIYMSARPSVYLAGPITGLTFDDSVEWRDYAKQDLDDAGIDAFSPLRVKGYLRAFGELDAGTDNSKYAGVHPLSNAAGIMARDRNDVRSRDMVLANFIGAERISVGTCIEIGWADAWRKPIVAVMEEDNIHRHAMLNQACGFIVPTIEDAIEIVKAVLLP